MTLTHAEEKRIIRLLRHENRAKIERILRTAATFLNWLADAVGTAAEIYGRVRKAAREFWQDLRDLFL